MTETTCQAPESFDFTNQVAPGPMWQPTHSTREWEETSWASCSGSMTLWQEPQNSVDSMKVMPP